MWAWLKVDNRQHTSACTPAVTVAYCPPDERDKIILAGSAHRSDAQSIGRCLMARMWGDLGEPASPFCHFIVRSGMREHFEGLERRTFAKQSPQLTDWNSPATSLRVLGAINA